MDVIVSIISAVIAEAVVTFGMFLLVRLEMRSQIKSYNKRHQGQYDENTNPWKMSQRYRDWYVENFANRKESSYRKDKI